LNQQLASPNGNNIVLQGGNEYDESCPGGHRSDRNNSARCRFTSAELLDFRVLLGLLLFI
jgi:hypothetical protein